MLRGPVKVRLIHDLALDACTERGLAEEYGVSQPTIHEFKVRYQHQIVMARGDIENKLSGLWVADKLNRLAELEDDIERINDALEVLEPTDRPRLYLAKHRALRLAAEELGQLAPRKVDATVSVRYEVVGVNMAALE